MTEEPKEAVRLTAFRWLIHVSRLPRAGSSNCHVELWYGIVWYRMVLYRMVEIDLHTKLVDVAEKSDGRILGSISCDNLPYVSVSD